MVIGRQGAGPGEFVSPMGAAVMPDGRMVTLDGMLYRVSFFGRDGEFLSSWSVRRPFSGGIDVLESGDVILGRRLGGGEGMARDSSVHRFSSGGQLIDAYLTFPAVAHWGESSYNMNAIALDSILIALRYTENVARLYDLATGVEHAESLGVGFYQPIAWTLEPGTSFQQMDEWASEQMLAWWLRDLSDDVYAAGFQTWSDSVDALRTRWVFASPESGPFAVSEPTAVHPAFIRDGRIYSVRIRPDGRTELIIGDAPKRPESE